MDINDRPIADDSDMSPYNAPPPKATGYVEEPEYDEYRGVWVLWDDKINDFREVPPPAGKDTE